MDALLAHRGIFRFTETDEAGEHVYSYCFTDEMIRQRMIVLLERHIEPLTDEDEWEGDELDGLEEEEEGGEEDAYFENDTEENVLTTLANSEAEYETSIAVLYMTDKVTYQFQLYHNSEPVLGPLLIYRVILDAIETIQLSNQQTLIANLAGIATGVSTAEEIKNKEWRNNSYNLTVDRINSALRMYSEYQAGKK